MLVGEARGVAQAALTGMSTIRTLADEGAHAVSVGNYGTGYEKYMAARSEAYVHILALKGTGDAELAPIASELDNAAQDYLNAGLAADDARMSTFHALFSNGENDYYLRHGFEDIAAAEQATGPGSGGLNQAVSGLRALLGDAV